jgi:hypothetical protein
VKLHYEKWSQKKRFLIFEHYNLVDLKEWKAVTFLAWFWRRKLQAPKIASLILKFNFLGKMVSPTMSKIA